MNPVSETILEIPYKNKLYKLEIVTYNNQKYLNFREWIYDIGSQKLMAQKGGVYLPLSELPKIMNALNNYIGRNFSEEN